jgi:hypothetical protein
VVRGRNFVAERNFGTLEGGVFAIDSAGIWCDLISKIFLKNILNRMAGLVVHSERPRICANEAGCPIMMVREWKK